MTTPEQWYQSAAARWRHLPAGEERERRVERTFRKIRQEAEWVAVGLPELDAGELEAVLNEAVLSVHARLGLPLNDADEEAFDWHVDDLAARLIVLAREQKAAPRIRGELLERRMARRWWNRTGEQR